MNNEKLVKLPKEVERIDLEKATFMEDSTSNVELPMVDEKLELVSEQYNEIASNKIPALQGQLETIVHLCTGQTKEEIESFINSINDNSKILLNGTISNRRIVISNKKNIIIDGNNTKLTDETSFDFNNCENIMVSGFDSDNYRGNASFIFKNCIRVKICNNNFKDTPSFGVRFIRSKNNICKDIIISNNTFESVSVVNTWAGAIYIDGQGKGNEEDTSFETLPIENIIICNNTFRNIGTGAVNLGGAKNVTIGNNIFDSSYGRQSMLITMSRESTDIIITGNTFKKVGWENIVIHFASNVSVVGNYFEDFGYGVQVETGSKNIVISSNIFIGKKDNRTFIDENMQKNTYSIGIINSENVTVTNNFIDDSTFGIMLGKNGKCILISSNTIKNSINSIGIDQNGRENITISNNTIENCSRGIWCSVDNGYLKIESNVINVIDYCIKPNSSLTNVNILIKNNYCDGKVAIDNSVIYNGSAYFEIINNTKTETTVPYKKYGIQNWSGKVLWDNPTFILDKDLIIEQFVRGSKVNFNETNFSAKPTGLSSSLGYYLAKSENGVIFIMNDNVWKKKTGGGGSTQITTNDW